MQLKLRTTLTYQGDQKSYLTTGIAKQKLNGSNSLDDIVQTMTETLQPNNSNSSSHNDVLENHLDEEHQLEKKNTQDSLSKSPSTTSTENSDDSEKPGLLQRLFLLGAMGLGMNLGPDDDKLDSSWFTFQTQQINKKVLQPYRQRIIWVGFLIALDVGLLITPLPDWLAKVEFGFGLFVSLNFCLLGFALFKKIFDVYLLRLALNREGSINSEILVLYRFIANTAIVLLTVFTFSQAHHLNLVGLIASIGIGGIAVALASQKILEQVLWSFVLYLDRPFVENDYIHLPDRTFGRVESIGWRSTKVRLSGKGTLVVIPNSTLTQVNIENLTGAEKMISIVNLTFFRSIPDEEKALIRQVILQSTSDINGLDHKLTQVEFEDSLDSEGNEIVEGRINFFVLGSGEVSREMLSRLLKVARQNVYKKLKGYGIAFDLEEKTINIASPMNI